MSVAYIQPKVHRLFGLVEVNIQTINKQKLSQMVSEWAKSWSHEEMQQQKLKGEKLKRVRWKTSLHFH